ncbi:secretin N-terminal domain-containing protein [Luteolibacter marinus]|uniref:secretin N-terminal domain-containing protein n=1 Tax=Luteolibacter marinus TaxID=2776705 RepID=UPI0018696595|nr:secretin N-terminal domain-containing protein [Luteolibacter marinus]
MLLKPHLYIAGLMVAGTAYAQDPAERPAGAPVPPGAVPPVAAANNNPALAQTVKKDGFLEPKINGERLAELYTQLTGRRVTVSNAAIAAEFRFVQQGPITYGEAAQLLKTAAVMEGFVFIPSGENHDKLVYSQSVAAPPDENLPTITDPADLPEDEQVVTYVMNLKFIKPDEVVRTFTSVVKQFGNYGSIAAVPNASAVIITENTSLIRRLIELQQTIDVPTSNLETRFIKVQYADVQELSETLNEILNTQQSQQTTAATRRVGNAAPAPAANLPAGITPPGGADGGGGAGEDVPIQIVPATRTNEIFAMGRPVDVVFVESLVRGFDSPSDTRNFLRRKLKFLAVADFLPIAEQALERAYGASSTGGSAGGGSTGAGGRSTGANFGGGSRTSGNSRSTSSSSNNSSFGSNNSFGGGGSTGGLSGGSSLGDPNVSTAPEAMLVGRTLLVADNITNSIVIQGPPAGLEIITQLLDEIDVKADQVMISCVFGQLSLGNDFNFGIDYLRTVENRGDNAIGGRGGSGTSGALLPLDGAAFDPGDLAASAGLGVYGKIGPYLNVYLKALQSTDRFNVISRPTVFMANNQKGTISSGQEIAVPTNSFNSGTTGQSTNIEYRPVVLALEVIPLVNSEDEVTLQIYLKNDEVLGVQVIESIGEVPTIATRELVTTVTVPNNETIVLGGLITTRDRKTKSGIPILSQIPYIGGLFGSTTTGKDREELLIFIQPKIIKDSSSLYEGQVETDSRYEIDDLNRGFIDGPAVIPTAQEPVSAGKGVEVMPAEPEKKGGPRRASSRPRSFINRR